MRAPVPYAWPSQKWAAAALRLGVVAMAMAMAWMLVDADPIPAVDLDKCEATYLFPRNVPGDCCPPKLGTQAKDWKPDDCGGAKVRVRRPCHKLEEWEQERYNRAYDLMRNQLASDDPRSLYAQNNVHCSYCMLSHPLPWSDAGASGDAVDARLQIHFTWLLFPWHRWFLYFHERTLARLLGDDTFALCYWHWDNMLEEGAAQIPAPFVHRPALYDQHRSARHQPPAVADLGYTFTPNSPVGPEESPGSPAEVAEQNLALVHQAVVGVETREGFFGGAYRRGHGTVPFFAPTQGSVEASLHNAVHLWTGDEAAEDAVDMGSFWAAAYDPIFYSHHAAVDRLWNVWKSLGGWRSDIDDPDYLDTQFTLYDHDGEYVRVKVADALDSSSQLCYHYETVPEADALWINYQSNACSKQLDSPQKKRQWLRTIPDYHSQFGAHDDHDGSGDSSMRVVSLTAANSPFTTRIKRPQQKPPAPAHGPGSVEVLVFQDVSINWNKTASAMVFVHLHPDAGNQPSVTCAEFLAMFSNMPRSLPLHAGAGAAHKASYHWGLDRKLAQLDAAGLEDVAVTIVVGEQHTTHNPISIASIRIQYETR